MSKVAPTIRDIARRVAPRMLTEPPAALRELLESKASEEVLLSLKPRGCERLAGAMQAMWMDIQKEWEELEQRILAHQSDQRVGLAAMEGRLNDFRRLLEQWWAEVPPGAKFEKLEEKGKWERLLDGSVANISKMWERRGRAKA